MEIHQADVTSRACVDTTPSSLKMPRFVFGLLSNFLIPTMRSDNTYPNLKLRAILLREHHKNFGSVPHSLSVLVCLTFHDLSSLSLSLSPPHSQTQEMTGASHREVTVHGLLLYFPYHNGQASRPTISFTSHTQDGDIKECYDLVDDLPPEEDKLFRVYWQNRLVPETQLSQMPFFPQAKTLLQCERLKIPVGWKDRLRGFIFFDSNFVNISNNKLKIKADPDFETWIHEKEIKRRITYNPKNIDKDFEKYEMFSVPFLSP
jgi:hypothetical protein